MSLVHGKRVMHIDTSCKLHERRNTGIAFRILKTGEHKGLALSNQLKRELDRDLESDYDYPRLYAICIYQLIKDSLKDFDTLVICDDEDFMYVKLYLDFLFKGDREYESKEIISIGRLRDITGNSKLKSQADSVANIYRRKVLRKVQRRQRGIELNIVPINYSLVTKLWGEIEKNNVSRV